MEGELARVAAAQGYWMGRPMPVDEFLPWLKQWRPLEVAALRALA